MTAEQLAGAALFGLALAVADRGCAGLLASVPLAWLAGAVLGGWRP